MAFGVVGDVKPGTLELEGGRRNQALHCATASLVLLDRRIGESLQDLEGLAATMALVFVKRHDSFRPSLLTV
jgi:hypothetical protein